MPVKYRPIVLRSCIAKIFELIILTRMRSKVDGGWNANELKDTSWNHYKKKKEMSNYGSHGCHCFIFMIDCSESRLIIRISLYWIKYHVPKKRTALKAETNTVTKSTSLMIDGHLCFSWA